ncbi:MAG: hypothetical protein M3Y88_03630, partial [Chloroflexota bacterium]|nr:hypothetical protein [Chloroflexota bacterium]
TTTSLADRASRRLASAGRRALSTSDSGAAIKLLERALALQGDPTAARADILVALGEALGKAGRLSEARSHLQEALSWAESTGDPVAQAVVNVALYYGWGEKPLIAEAAATLVEAGLHREAAMAYRRLAYMHLGSGDLSDCLRYVDLAIAQATESPDRHLLARLLAMRAWVWGLGPMPVAAAIEAIEGLLLEVVEYGSARSLVLLYLVAMYGQIGRFDDARAAAAQSRASALELGQPIAAAGTSHASGPMERLAGRVEAAERELRADNEALEAAGEQLLRSTTLGYLAHVLCDRAALDEALELTVEAEAISDDEDYLSQILWRSARARALARRDPQAALALAMDAVDRTAATDILIDRGDALLSLAEVLDAIGRPDDAAHATEEAIVLFQAKGATAYVERAERLLAQVVAKKAP